MQIHRNGSRPSAKGPDGKGVEWPEQVSDDDYRAANSA